MTRTGAKPPLATVLVAPVALVALVALILSGCAGPWLVPDPPAPNYSPRELAYAVSGREIPVRVLSAPVAAPAGTFEARVVDLISASYAGPPTRFVAASSLAAAPPGTDDPTRSGYHVVLIFNAATPFPASRACAVDSPPLKPLGGPLGGPPDGPIKLQAAFCSGASAETSVTGYLEAARSLDDPSLLELIHQTTIQLFQQRPGDNALEGPFAR